MFERFINWLTGRIPAREPRRSEPRPKFFEGTEWTCPDCGETIAVAKRDIYRHERRFPDAWDVKNRAAYRYKHCGRPAVRVNPCGITEIHTPTGWVG